MSNEETKSKNNHNQSGIQMTEKNNVTTNTSNTSNNRNRHYRYQKRRESTQPSQPSQPSQQKTIIYQSPQEKEEHIIYIHEDDESTQTENDQPHFIHQIDVREKKTEYKDEECQSEDWNIICCKLDKNCIVYFSQLGLITLCVSVSLYQIVSGSQTNRDFFIALLSSSLGYVLPAPKLKKK